MIRQLAKSVREYKKPALFTLVFIILEVIIECFIPFITADLVNKVKTGAEVAEICQIGVILAVMAICSLACGGLAGFTCAKASAGFAKNLRHDVFRKIQDFSRIFPFTRFIGFHLPLI